MRILALVALLLLAAVGVSLAQTVPTLLDGQEYIGIAAPNRYTRILLDLTTNPPVTGTYDVALTIIPTGVPTLPTFVCPDFVATCDNVTAVWSTNSMTNSLLIPRTHARFTQRYTIVVLGRGSVTNIAFKAIGATVRDLSSSCAKTAATIQKDYVCYSTNVIDRLQDLRLAVRTSSSDSNEQFVFPDMFVSTSRPLPNPASTTWSFAGNAYGDVNTMYFGLDHTAQTYTAGRFFICAKSTPILGNPSGKISFSMWASEVTFLKDQAGYSLALPASGSRSQSINIPYSFESEYMYALQISCPNSPQGCNIYAAPSAETCAPSAFTDNTISCTNCNTMIMKPASSREILYGDYAVTVTGQPDSPYNIIGRAVTMWGTSMFGVTNFDNPIIPNSYDYYTLSVCDNRLTTVYATISSPQDRAMLLVSASPTQLPDRSAYDLSTSNTLVLNGTTLSSFRSGDYFFGVYSDVPTLYSISLNSVVRPQMLSDGIALNDICSCDYNYYQVNLATPGSDFVVFFTPGKRSHIAVYMSTQSMNPTMLNFQYMDAANNFDSQGRKAVTFTSPAVAKGVAAQPVNYYLGVKDCRGSLGITASISTSLLGTIAESKASATRTSIRYFSLLIPGNNETIIIRVKPIKTDNKNVVLTMFVADGGNQNLRPTNTSFQWRSNTGYLSIDPEDNKYTSGNFHIGVTSNIDVDFQISTTHYPTAGRGKVTVLLVLIVIFSILGVPVLLFLTYYSDRIKKRCKMVQVYVEDSYDLDAKT